MCSDSFSIAFLVTEDHTLVPGVASNYFNLVGLGFWGGGGGDVIY